MTTVAYKDGVIAGDGLCTHASYVSSRSFQKIVATDSHLAGISGQADYGAAFLEWVKAGCDPKHIPLSATKTTGDIDAFVVDASGNVTAYGQDMMPLSLGRPKFYAVGSGWAFAIGAMAMGASAEQAVRIAAKFDTATGGKIVTRRLKRAKKRPRKHKNGKEGR